MGICASELLEYVIRPTLRHLGVVSAAAETLLLGTAARETGLGYHLGNCDSGAGIYRIDAVTHRRVWDEFLAFQPDFASAVRGLASQHEFLADPDAELATNLRYATAIAWVIYLWKGADISGSPDLHRLGDLWRNHFRPGNHPDPEDFEDSYLRYVCPDVPRLAAVRDARGRRGHFAA